MNIVIWIITVLLALAFLGAGLMKLAQPKAKLAASGMAWTEDFGQGTVRAIGALEVLGALGLVVPALLNAPGLVPYAALGLVAVMLGAAATHVRRKEPQIIGVNLVLAALAAVVAWGRLGAVPFAS